MFRLRLNEVLITAGYLVDFVERPRPAAIATWMNGDERAMEVAERKMSRHCALTKINLLSQTHILSFVLAADRSGFIVNSSV